jgi:hypothetical protein
MGIPLRSEAATVKPIPTRVSPLPRIEGRGGVRPWPMPDSAQANLRVHSKHPRLVRSFLVLPFAKPADSAPNRHRSCQTAALGPLESECSVVAAEMLASGSPQADSAVKEKSKMRRRFCCGATGKNPRAASPRPRQINRKSSSPGNKERASAKAHIAGLLAKRLPSTRQGSRARRNGVPEIDSRRGEKWAGTAVVARAACHIKKSLPAFLTAFAELRKNGCPVARSSAVTIVGLILSLNGVSPKYSRSMSSMRFRNSSRPWVGLFSITYYQRRDSLAHGTTW